MTQPVIVWFRDDLRLADNPALSAAAASGAPVLAVYILDDKLEKPPGAASLWWLHHSLERLADGLSEIGGRLIFRRGNSAESLRRFARETVAQAIYWNRSHEPAERRREAEVAAEMAEIEVEVFRQKTDLLFDPGSVRTKTGGQYSVFTPFYRACLATDPPASPLPAPTSLSAPETWPDSEQLEDWQLLPTAPDWAGGLRDAWTPGEAAAGKALDDFLDSTVRSYRKGRDIPGKQLTSRLSPHLHFGEISSRQVWHVTKFRIDRSDGGPVATNGEAFLRELVWREFSCHLLSRTPTLPTEPLKPEFRDFPWTENYTEKLKAWQTGQTGYPIVDAGMRELWTTGWMHNRVRMVT
ncbi:MAG: deoxyribodipyrimidine photo-lyase, partial [Rhodospirillales bacterium]